MNRIERQRHPPPALRVGIVGAGAMGRVHCNAWMQTDATLTAICSLDDSANRLVVELAAADPAGIADSIRLCSSLDELLELVDIVDICTPTDTHHTVAIAAAAAGCHILCEKPMARTADQAQKMAEACETAGVTLMVAHVLRFFPEYAAAARLATSGELGKVALLRLRRSAFAPAPHGENWFRDLRRSGGVLLDMMLHDFDMARLIAGDVRSVYARHIRDEHGEHACALLTHHNNILSHIEGSWAYPPPHFSTHFEIACEKGEIIGDSTNTNPLRILRRPASDGESTSARRSGTPKAAPAVDPDPYRLEIAAFYEAVRNRTAPPISAAEGIAALRIALAAEESVANGQAVIL